jgi:hypothetical protein
MKIVVGILVVMLINLILEFILINREDDGKGKKNDRI